MRLIQCLKFIHPVLPAVEQCSLGPRSSCSPALPIAAVSSRDLIPGVRHWERRSAGTQAAGEMQTTSSHAAHPQSHHSISSITLWGSQVHGTPPVFRSQRRDTSLLFFLFLRRRCTSACVQAPRRSASLGLPPALSESTWLLILSFLLLARLYRTKHLLLATLCDKETDQWAPEAEE